MTTKPPRGAGELFDTYHIQLCYALERFSLLPPEIISVLSIEDNMSFIGSTLRMYLAVCLVMGEGVQWLG